MMPGLLAILLGIALIPSVFAQNATLTPISGFQVFAGGGGYQGSYTNIQLRAALSGDFSTTPNPVTMSVSGAPAGVTYLFTTNSFTNSQTMFLQLTVSSVAKGTYPLTVSATTNGVPVGNSFVIPLIVGTLWTNATTDINWSTAANWSAGVPANNDDVMFQDAASNTNYVDSSATVGSLTIIRNTSNTSQEMSLAPGTTLSIVGTNGLAMNEDSYPGNSKTMQVTINGADATLLVTNASANVAINGINAGSKSTTLTMSGLDNFFAYVNRFGVADVNFALQGGVGAQIARVDFATNNLINASYVGDYTRLDYIPYAISFCYNSDSYNNGSSQTFNLGIQNAFQADSIGLDQGRMGGSSSAMTFNSLFTKPTTPPSVSFRNTDGASRVSLVGLAVDAGTNQTGSNTKFNLNLVNGNVDMLVDQMWIARNRFTNNANAAAVGKFEFNDGTVDVNTLRLGYQAYTNDSFCQGSVTVGGNATNSALLKVNADLDLGYTSGDYAGGADAAKGYGQVTIGTNGIVKASQITVGQLSGNNTITINNGGTLLVTNTVASATTALGTLTVNSGGVLTLNVNGGNTLVYVTNLVASSGVINIASITGSSSFIPIISYAPGDGEGASFVAGSVPGGYNATLFNNTTTHTIDVTLTTGTPKTLLWQGYVDNTWNNSTKNWLDTVTGLHTNFSTGDSVMFDDTAAFNNINVTEDVVPRQATGINGISMTNNTLSYVFSGAGGIRGAALFLKAGTNSVEIDNYTEVAAQVAQGLMTVSGTVGSLTVAPGAACSLLGGGILIGNADNYGSLTNAGTIGGSLTAEAGGTAINNGTINGALAMANGSLVYNYGNLYAVGPAHITTNSTLINGGTIYGTTVTVDLGGTLIDTVNGFPGQSPGSINIADLVVNGTFEPGGNAIAMTKVTDFDSSGNPLLNPYGRVQLNPGSTTTLIVNMDLAPAQTNTVLLSQNQGFGPSQNFKAFNGGTLEIINDGSTPYAPGQIFKMFGYYYDDSDIKNAGLNTTNSYPIIQPATPGPGLVWDLSQLIPHGTIGVLSASDPSMFYTLTNSTTAYPAATNIVTELSWPADKTGGWVQELNTTLTNGLSATNWFTPSGGYLTNMPNVNDIFITNTLVGDPTAPGSAIFFRFVYP